MANTKLALLPLALTLLLVSPAITLAQIWGFQGQQSQWQQPFGQSSQHRRLQRGQQIQNDCQINQLTASEPTNRIESEAGVTEIWEPNQQQELRCAGVTVIRHQIETRGLVLPHYVNAPKITYVVQGRGLIGVTIPGCPETFETGFAEQSEEKRDWKSERSTDQHQKVRRFRQGEIIALPAGVSKWIYNDGQERLILVSLYDTNNFQNQLDENLKAFYLAGNPQGRGGEHGRHQQGRHETRRHGQSQQTNLGQNIFSGFDEELLAEAFGGIDRETVQSLQGQNDNRGLIVRVEKDLKVLAPEWDREEERMQMQRGREGREGRDSEDDWREREHGRHGRETEEERREREHGRHGRETEEERREREHGHHGRETEDERREREHGREGRRGGSNGVEETICSLRLKENIDIPERADVFNPHGGRLTSLNSHKLPILNFLQLSAEKVNLYKNSILAPHWRINAHTIAYFTRGQGRIQVVNNEGRLVFDDTVKEGQLLVIPQNYAVVKRAGHEGLEWVSFLTNDNSMISPLAGRISAIRGMPEEVVMNSWGVSREEAKRLKYGRQELTVFSPSSRSDRRGDEFAIV